MDSEQSYEPRTSDRNESAMLVHTERRRRWSDQEKLEILRETTEPGAIVSRVARRHGISTGQLSTWRKQLVAGAMAGFVSVDLSVAPAGRGTALGRIDIASPGGMTVSIDRLVDREALKLVLGVLAEAV